MVNVRVDGKDVGHGGEEAGGDGKEAVALTNLVVDTGVYQCSHWDSVCVCVCVRVCRRTRWLIAEVIAFPYVRTKLN